MLFNAYMNYFISLSAFPCGTFSIAFGNTFSVSHTKVKEWFSFWFLAYFVLFILLNYGIIKLAVWLRVIQIAWMSSRCK